MQVAVKPAKTNLDTGFLGIVAVICMVIDHAGAKLFPSEVWMRVIGRIAFPLFAWGIAVGAEHTRNMGRYALRLFLMMIISQPFYMFALDHTLLKLNIFATLFLGLVGIWGLKERKEWMTAIALMLAHLLGADYGLRGVLCILLLWGCREKPLALAVCFSAFCVIWGESSFAVLTTPYFAIRLQTCAILALPLMLIPKATRTKTPRWLMYAVYPGHLALLWLVRELLKA